MHRYNASFCKNRDPEPSEFEELCIYTTEIPGKENIMLHPKTGEAYTIINIVHGSFVNPRDEITGDHPLLVLVLTSYLNKEKSLSENPFAKIFGGRG